MHYRAGGCQDLHDKTKLAQLKRRLVSTQTRSQKSGVRKPSPKRLGDFAFIFAKITNLGLFLLKSTLFKRSIEITTAKT